MERDYLDRIKDTLRNGKRAKALSVGISILLVLSLCIAFIKLSDPGEGVVFKSEDSTQLVDGEEGSALKQSGTKTIYVHIAGEVASPGVYELDYGARVDDAVEAAGGFTEDADSSGTNLARVLADGEQVVIQPLRSGEDSEEGEAVVRNGGNSDNQPKRLNINSASAEELESLPGIGPALAKRIIDYRNKIGSFRSPEDIKNVSGIGSRKYETIESYIMV